MIRRPPRSTPLSLHDALPISSPRRRDSQMKIRFLLPIGLETWWRDDPGNTDRTAASGSARQRVPSGIAGIIDRKSTRLNSSHLVISYAVFFLKKKKQTKVL